jgi:hypothetical protein
VTERGILYIATGAAHLGAARDSAASARRSNPDLPIAVFTDIPEPFPEFDLVFPVENPHQRSKVDYLHRSPFAETLYLDSDTRIFGELSDMFRLLERFDLALAHVPRNWARRYQRQGDHPVPASFPTLNAGVILYRKTPEVIAFLDAWGEAYRRSGRSGDDQMSLRETAWLSDLRLAILPPAYNTRRVDWTGGRFSRRPRPVILHCNLYHPSKSGPLHRLARRLVDRAG